MNAASQAAPGRIRLYTGAQASDLRRRACSSAPARVRTAASAVASLKNVPCRHHQRSRRNVQAHALFHNFNKGALKVVSIAQLKARWLGFSEVCTEGAVFKSGARTAVSLTPEVLQSMRECRVCCDLRSGSENSCFAADLRASLISSADCEQAPPRWLHASTHRNQRAQQARSKPPGSL